MVDAPWLTIVGIGEDGMSGLPDIGRSAIAQAELVIGPARHLALVSDLKCQTMVWPAPFDTGLSLLLEQRGRRVVMLASGDPFWFGAGSVVARHLEPGEWVAHPVPSTFALASARLGWPIEDTACVALHAAPFGRLRRHVAERARALVLVRDGAAVGALARYLRDIGFGRSRLHVMEALGGPRERCREAVAAELTFDDIAHPVALGIVFAGDGATLPHTGGIPNAWFAHDGQITKRPIRALTLSALAPGPGETLWDIGSGSGSIAIEWLLAHRATEALAFEADPARATRIRDNADALGVDRLRVVEGYAPATLADHAPPDAVFIGGGLSQALLDTLWTTLGAGTRLVANAVTLESETLLAHWQSAKGGGLTRIALSDVAPIGSRRGWKAAYPVVQWSVVL